MVNQSTSYPALSLDSSDPDVKELQGNLQSHGYSVEADGIFGEDTKNGVKDFQASQNLTVDGLLESPDVKELQGNLQSHGYNVEADEIFGEDTKNTVNLYLAPYV
jgi:peptidoglycan hydrolase-like protein with peptidoglycan-binding domain